MNPISADPTAPPLPPPAQPPRSSFSCDRHPEEQFTGFCPSCLCERLTTLDQSSSNTPSSSRRPSSASAAIKSFFTSSSSKTNNNFPPPPPPPKAAKPSSSFFPELRRSKSFSASKNEALGLAFEPQRKSCDVRGRSTLSTLFTLDNDSKSGVGVNRSTFSSIPISFPSSSSFPNQQNSKIVLQEEEKDGVFREIENVEVGEAVSDDNSDGDEIRPVRDSHLESLRNLEHVMTNGGEIVEEDEQQLQEMAKPMKEHIDNDGQEKKSSGGKFWAAASVLGKKWHKWRRKHQKIKKENSGDEDTALPVQKPISRQYGETQSEVADYGFGRRSCDIDPRFSLDAARTSFDDPRYSLDEPRASWDGYLYGRSFPRMAPMVSVMEDASAVHTPRIDMQIPVEEPILDGINEVEGVPGGLGQTKEYYLDSSTSRRRKSLDRSSSTRTAAAAAALVAEIDEIKTATPSSNAKVSPAAVGERESKDLNSRSMRDDSGETFELGSGVLKDGDNSIIGNGEKKEAKKSKKWSWKLWNFLQRINGGNKVDEDDKQSKANGVARSYSASWQDTRREGNGDGNKSGFNMFRSNSSVSWRNANPIGGSFGSMRKSDGNGPGGKKRKDDVVLERNRSARYSPNHVDNGLLRLYLAPLRTSRRGGFGFGNKIKSNNNAQSIARSVLKLY